MLDQIKVQLCSAWGSDKEAAHAAWASTYDQEKLEEKSDEDIRRIASNIVVQAHDTPKERVWMEFFLTVPIFVERQLDKYRMSTQFQDIQVECQVAEFGRHGITQNELSGRYRTIPNRPYSLPRDVVDIMVKVGGDLNSESDEEQAKHIVETWDEMLQEQHEMYDDALKEMRKAEAAGTITNAEYKRAREVLRSSLGTAFLTDMRWVLNLNAFEHVINQRIDGHAQMESRVTAYLMVQEALKNNVATVIVSKMVEKNGWQANMDEVEAALKADVRV